MQNNAIMPRRKYPRLRQNHVLLLIQRGAPRWMTERKKSTMMIGLQILRLWLNFERDGNVQVVTLLHRVQSSTWKRLLPRCESRGSRFRVSSTHLHILKSRKNTTTPLFTVMQHLNLPKHMLHPMLNSNPTNLQEIVPVVEDRHQLPLDDCCAVVDAVHAYATVLVASVGDE